MRSKVGVGPSENFVFGQIWRPLTDADATMFFQKSCQRSPARQAAKTVPKTAVYAAPRRMGSRDLARLSRWPFSVFGVVGVGPRQNLRDLDRLMVVDLFPIELGQELAHEIVKRSIPVYQLASVPAEDITGLNPIPVFRLAEPQFLSHPAQVAMPVLRDLPESGRHTRELPLAPFSLRN